MVSGRQRISRTRQSYSPSGTEVAQAIAALVGALVVYGAFAFGLDAIASQLVLFVLGSFHIVAGFWQAFLLVITVTFLVGLSAAAGSHTK